MKALVRFQSDIVKHPCGNEIFVQNATTTVCEKCGKPLVINHVIKLPEYKVTAAKSTRIYRCQLGMCNADEALEKVGVVVAKDTANGQVLGLRNMTPNVLIGITPSGKQNQVKPGDVIPLKAGIKLEVYDSKLEIE